MGAILRAIRDAAPSTPLTRIRFPIEFACEFCHT